MVCQREPGSVGSLAYSALCWTLADAIMGSVRATMTISFYERACSCYRWGLPDGRNIAVHAFACCYVTGRGWVLNGSQEG
jgi:hypothetical protein